VCADSIFLDCVNLEIINLKNFFNFAFMLP